MLVKKPKVGNIFMTAIKSIIVLEIVVCGSSYLLWKSMNHNRDLRYQMREKFPPAYKMYHWIGRFCNKDYVLDRQDEKYFAQKEANNQ